MSRKAGTIADLGDATSLTPKHIEAIQYRSLDRTYRTQGSATVGPLPRLSCAGKAD
ncbi:MAG TPA: hypothetical protein VFE61_16705 [Candidatus Sulfotelmatobacter sp.]|nr:hypothetical protein [Candidatus Sulfotelmatobacter sp.]